MKRRKMMQDRDWRERAKERRQEDVGGRKGKREREER